MSLNRFPSAFPVDEVRLLLPLLRGGPVANKWELAEAGWWVVGFAASQLQGGFSTGMGLDPARKRAKGIADELEKALAFYTPASDRKARRERRGETAPVIDWKKIVQVLIPILLDLFSGGG